MTPDRLYRRKIRKAELAFNNRIEDIVVEHYDDTYQNPYDRYD